MDLGASTSTMHNGTELEQCDMMRQFIRACSPLCGTHHLKPSTLQKLSKELKNLDFAKTGLKLPEKGSLKVPMFASGVYQNERISCSIFGFRKEGDVLPLHDHTDMYGFIRVMRGRIQIDSYSWINDETLEVRAEPQVILEGDNIAILGPSEGNIHQITALTDDAAFFDLLVPGYIDRTCEYYRVTEGPDSAGTCLLEPIDMSYGFMRNFPGNEVTDV
uniref:Cysteine dioxygenase n=1 Tax=Steinernema glaseri TaxID=37863 RepID=A0A1I7ZBP3_9BILA